MKKLFCLLVTIGVFISAWFDPRVLCISGFCVLCQVSWLRFHGRPIID